tara:strand:- start:2301 stop:2921 length:621 start_codon:yes stop_codon:yes gene_type:complete
MLLFFYYWNDPRIHEVGNGKVSAFFARAATKFINTFSYKGRNVRDEILTKMIDNHDSVLDMCCGTGTSTPYKTELNKHVLGIDTSKAMITEARWRRGPNGLFEIANAENFGDESSFDVVTIFFALHEMPQYARKNVLENALRVAKKKVIMCDISPYKMPSNRMLKGEPYLQDYQNNILAELASFDNVKMFEPAKGRVLCAILPSTI